MNTGEQVAVAGMAAGAALIAVALLQPKAAATIPPSGGLPGTPTGTRPPTGGGVSNPPAAGGGGGSSPNPVGGNTGGSWGGGGTLRPFPYNQQCVGVNSGGTTITFSVAPWNPPRQVGAGVNYNGRLLAPLADIFGFLIGVEPVVGAIIEFWDANQCVMFDSAVTDSDGYFSLPRGLRSDELGGYDVFAFFRGGSGRIGFLTPQDPVASQAFPVRPQ